MVVRNQIFLAPSLCSAFLRYPSHCSRHNMQHKEPSIDDKNPFWCPSLSATSYINSVRRRNRTNVVLYRKNKDYLKSFLYSFEKALIQDPNSSDDDVTSKRFFLLSAKRKRPRRKHRKLPGFPASNDDPLNFSYAVPVWEQDQEESVSPTPTRESWLRSLRDSNDDWCIPHTRPPLLNKFESSFSDIDGPTAHELSKEENQDSSFDVVLQHETLVFPPAGLYSSPHPQNIKPGPKADPAVRIQELEDQLYGPAIGTQSPLGIKYFITQLDSILPGVRLQDRLCGIQGLSHDSIAYFLASNGYLNARVLAFLRSSEVRKLSMTESLRDANGLNICRGDTMAVFSSPNSFHHLSELSFSSCRISEFDFIHITRLPSLSSLVLDNTAVSNQTVFLLVPLKSTLIQLSIARNPAVNDDAIPALLLLPKLSYLSILGTGIAMPGVRRLASVISEERRVIEIEIPTICEEYITNMHALYALDIRPPLVSEGYICSLLSIAALERNLEAHAVVNKDISVVGTKAEMADRLRALLETRALDLLVREMILGPEEEETL